ncbi:MAG: hypothetical protein NVS4B3_08260 [Gemmatimonadaceae bacterium]
MTLEPNAAHAHGRPAITRHLPTAARIMMGLLFAVTGLNGFINFLPQPTTPMPEGAVAFQTGLMRSGYMFPLIMGTQLTAGVLLLANRFVPLALALIAPVVVNIFAFHVFLVRAGLPLAIVVVVLEVYLAWTYRRVYVPMFAATPGPGASAGALIGGSKSPSA